MELRSCLRAVSGASFSYHYSLFCVVWRNFGSKTRVLVVKPKLLAMHRTDDRIILRSQNWPGPPDFRSVGKLCRSELAIANFDKQSASIKRSR